MDGADSSPYTIEDLAKQSGFDVRSIRSLIEQGLLRGPSSLGRYARYSQSHLIRLLAIKALKEKKGLKIADIRQTLLYMNESDIRALAETIRNSEQPSPISALDYIRSLNAIATESSRGGDPASQAIVDTADQASPHLGQISPSRVPRQQSGEASPSVQSKKSTHLSREVSNSEVPEQQVREPLRAYQSTRQQPTGESWIRFQITPDVELSVRGIQTDAQLSRMQQIANRLRDILIGGENE